MTSTALPPLPSARARELEKKAASLAASNFSSEFTETTQSPIQGGSKDEKIGSAKSSNIKKDENRALPATSQSLIEKMSNERIQQLSMMHQQEKKVFGHHTPLEPNLICDSVHQYIATTSQFLNSFIADANASLEGTSHKLSVLERQMSMLENKLAYIPGLIPGHDGEENDKSNDGEEEEEEGNEDGTEDS